MSIFNRHRNGKSGMQLIKERELLDRARKEVRGDRIMSPAAWFSIIVVTFPVVLHVWFPKEKAERRGPKYNWQTVQRRKADNLTYQDFFSEYLKPRRSLVIEGLAERLLPQTWGWKHLRDVCGHMEVTPQEFRLDAIAASKPSSKASLDLSVLKPTTLREYMDGFREDVQDGQRVNAYPYLVFDEGLGSGCRDVLKGFAFPSYVTNDVLKRTRLTDPSADPFWKQPDLVIGMNHSVKGPIGGGLHKESFGSHQWELQVEGRKEWIIFCGMSLPEMESDLYSYRNGRKKDPVNFRYDAFRPNNARYPRAKTAVSFHAARFTAEPGDFVFIPAECPHQSQTLSSYSLALSGNFVDAINFKEFVKLHGKHGDKADKAKLTGIQASVRAAGGPPTGLHEPPDVLFSDHTANGLRRHWEEGARRLEL